MYSRKTWGGHVDPYILVKFVRPDSVPEGQDPIVSLVIFEWKDRSLIGKPDPKDEMVVCDTYYAAERCGWKSHG